MDAESEIGESAKRWLIGGFGLLLLVTRLVRLWQWWTCDGDGMTIWQALGGPRLFANNVSNASRLNFFYGLWELNPDGRLAATGVLLLMVTCLLAAFTQRDIFYKIGGGIVISGYLLNAALLLRLMANY